MSRLTLGQFVAACDGRMLDARRPDESALPFIPSIDTRTLRRGETFVALRGPNHDGHHYLAAALQAGAAALVIDDTQVMPAACAVPVVVVDDAKDAYLRGAAAARRLMRGVTVVGVTGSNGKTTTKTFAAALIGRLRRVIATPLNENNELGVAKLCYALDDSVDVAIAEFGARHPGEILQLTDMALPDIAVLVNIGEAHMEYFSDREALARTKFAIFERGARAVCNAADEWTRRLALESGLDRDALWVRLCGDPEAPGLALEAGDPRDGRVAISLGASHAFASWHLIGEHNLRDALLAAGAALQCGLRFEDAIAGLGDLHLPPGRFEQHVLRSGASVVYDAYNASPTSMRHALHALRELPAQRRITVLGSMAELGSKAVALHEGTGSDAAAAGIDALYCGGEHAAALARGALDAGMPPASVHTYVTNIEIAETLIPQLHAGVVVLLKGSRVQRMEEILEALLAAPAVRTATTPPIGPEHRSRGVGEGGSPSHRGAEVQVSRFERRRRLGASGQSAAGIGVRAFLVRTDELPGDIIALPLRTPLVKSGDDLAQLVAQCVSGIADAEDVVCVAETAIAIAQGRSIKAEAIRPGFLARMLAERAGSYATMSQPESVQLVIEQVGTPRVLAAVVAGAAGRLVGRRGDFYRALGPAVAEIDGYTGTMAPYERHIVLGPRDPEDAAAAIARACGARVAIVDANDLRKVEILGASDGVDRAAVRACLTGNPHGNSDQQTPIVVLKYRPAFGSPAASPLLA